MKLNCGVIRDLLLLYANDDCCDSSREIVEEHLKECAQCREYLEQLRLPDFTAAKTPEEGYHEAPEAGAGEIKDQEEPQRVTRAVKKSLKKAKRRWWLSLAAILMIIPITIVYFLAGNERRKAGICFTNLDEIYTVGKYLKKIQAGDYEEAVLMTDYTADYESYFQNINGENFKPVKVQLDGEIWYASQFFAMYEIDYEIFKEYNKAKTDTEAYSETKEQDFAAVYSLEGEAAREKWEYFIYHSVSVLIPEQIWEDVVGDSYRLEKDSDGNEKYIVNCKKENKDQNKDEDEEIQYSRIKTKWGNFFLCNMDFTEKQNNNAYFLWEFTQFVPECIYKEAKPRLEKEQKEEVERMREENSWVLNLTEEEYSVIRHTELLDALKDYHMQKNEIVDIGFAHAYLHPDVPGWVIEYRVTEKMKNGKQTTYTLIFQVENGKVAFSGAYDLNGDIDFILLSDVFFGV
ncbi:MAG: hypothetical protein Q4F21_05110 [Lachnospiraceae bacterium]|nr:hypothetical protein [Lachnospiraceae bacterium]